MMHRRRFLAVPLALLLTALPVIPEYALDMHTAAGQSKGRGRRHFFEEASKTIPEMPERDKTYLERILKMLDEGKIKD